MVKEVSSSGFGGSVVPNLHDSHSRQTPRSSNVMRTAMAANAVIVVPHDGSITRVDPPELSQPPSPLLRSDSASSATRTPQPPSPSMRPAASTSSSASDSERSLSDSVGPEQAAKLRQATAAAGVRAPSDVDGRKRLTLAWHEKRNVYNVDPDESESNSCLTFIAALFGSKKS